MKQALILSTLLLFLACGNKTSKNNDIDTFMLDGPGSVYIPEEDRLDEESTKAIKADIETFVHEVYDEVNRRWQPNHLGKKYDHSLEEMFTTSSWQKLYNDVRDIERLYTNSDENHFFVEGGNTWTMGSFDAPFQVNALVVNPIDKRNAYVCFQLLPAESEGADIIWDMQVEDGVWRISNFIDDTPDFDSDESERFNYAEHMQAYFKAHMQ